MNLNTSIRRILWLAFTFANVATMSTVGVSQQAQFVREIEGVQQYKLSNGTKVLLYKDSSATTFTLNVTVRVGARHETNSETGLSHLLEHMLVRGTESFQQIPEMLNQRGALRMNGSASRDRIRFFETLPASQENLKFAISMEAERLTRSLLRDEDFQRDMNLVRSEFDRSESEPEIRLYNEIIATSFKHHNYRNPVFGNRVAVEKISVDAVKTFYTKYFRPDNTTVVLTGQFEPKFALSLLATQFGRLQNPPTPLGAARQQEPAQVGERSVVVRLPGASRMTGFAYRIPSASHPLHPAVEVFERLLLSEPAGPLYQLLSEQTLINRLRTRVWRTHDAGIFFVGAGIAQDEKMFEVQGRMINAIETIGINGVAPSQVRLTILQMLQETERRLGNSEQLALALGDWDARGDWRLLFLHRDRLGKVNLQQLRQVAKRYFARPNRTLGVFLPTSNPTSYFVENNVSGMKLLADYKGRKTVASGETFVPTPDNIEARTTRGRLADGLKYAILRKKTNNQDVFVRFDLRYGNEDSLKGLVVAGDLMPTMIRRGTKRLPSEQLKRKLAELSTTIDMAGRLGELQVFIQTKQDSLPEALQLMKQILREPRFDQQDFAVVKRLRLSRLKTRLKSPRDLAINAAQRELASQYPPSDVRYVPTLKERIERLENTKVQQLHKLHKECLGGSNGELAMVGDIDPESASMLLGNVFNGWANTVPCQRIAKKKTGCQNRLQKYPYSNQGLFERRLLCR